MGRVGYRAFRLSQVKGEVNGALEAIVRHPCARHRKHMNRAPGARWIAFLFGLLLTANGSMRDGGAVAAGELISELQALRLVPEHPTLWGAKASQRFVVLGTFADGLERDVTAHAVLTLSDPTLATIDSGARVTVRADGACDLIAQVGGCKASTRVQFEGSSQTLPFSFARDIGQILTKRGCNTSDCHGSVKGQKGFKLSLNASYPQEDYKWIIEGGVYKVLTTEQSEPPKPRINKEQPEESLILQKPAGVVPHGGGKRLDVGSMDYRTILAWVQNGAPYGEDDGKAPIAIEGLKAFPPRRRTRSPGQAPITRYGPSLQRPQRGRHRPGDLHLQ